MVGRVGSENTTEGADPAEDAPAWGSVLSLLGNGSFMVQCMAYSLLGGVSFAIPAVQAEVSRAFQSSLNPDK